MRTRWSAMGGAVYDVLRQFEKDLNTILKRRRLRVRMGAFLEVLTWASIACIAAGIEEVAAMRGHPAG